MRKLLYSICLVLFCLVWGVAQEADLFHIDSILEVKIYFDETNWDQQLDDLKQAGHDKRLMGEVIVNGRKFEEVGIRYKGNSSYFNVRNEGHSKLPFNIKLDYKGKDQALPGQITTLKLSNVFRDPSFIREVLAYEIAGAYMPAPRANFAKVYVNDKFLGLYNNTESIDELFLDQYYGEHKGTLVKCDPNWHVKAPEDCAKGDKASLMYLGQDSTCYLGLYEMKTDNGWGELIELTRVLNEDFERIEQVLNVDQALWMLAFDNVLVNLDSYIGQLCHNYYLYRDSFGVFHPMVWDMNLAFGGFRRTGIGNSMSNAAMAKMSPFIHFKEKNKKRPLITQLLSDSYYRKIYVAHIKTILEEQFLSTRYLQRIEAIQTLIKENVEEDENRLYELTAFEANVDTTIRVNGAAIVGIRELMEPRIQYLKNHPLLKMKQPSISEVEHVEYGEFTGFMAKVEGATRVWLCYRENGCGPFQKLELFDDSGHHDQAEGDSIWGGTLEKGKGLQYYIVAEADHTASLSPARAALQFYEIK